jgi:hypothetical protein
MNQAQTTPVVQVAAAIAAASMAAATATVMTGVGASGTQQHVAVPGRCESAIESYRDHQLRAFEQYLLQNMRASDVTKDEEGVYLFNVNQVAYFVEGSEAEDQQRCTRRRFQAVLPTVQHITMRVPPANKGG